VPWTATWDLFSHGQRWEEIFYTAVATMYDSAVIKPGEADSPLRIEIQGTSSN
jgi:hypothetical protein